MTALVLTQKTTLNPQSTDSTRSQYISRTILFNDEWHSFDDVASQLVKAIRCTYTKGLAYANIVHTTGNAIVYSGPMERCEAVAMTLEEIGLKVSVEK